MYGFGEMKTPLPFVHACSQFIYTENLQPEPEPESVPAGGKTAKTKAPSKKKSRKELRQDAWLVKLLRTAVEQTSGDDGWAHMSRVGHYISNNSSFSPVNYGYRKLSDLIKTSELFEVELRGGDSAIYVKDKRA